MTEVEDNTPVATAPESGKFKDVTSIVTFVSGGLGVVLLAVTNWGDDAAGLAAARRNHPYWLQGAVSLAAAGTLIAAAYVIWRQRLARMASEPNASKLARFAGGGGLLFVAVVAVLGGVVTGVIATTTREPGLPQLSIQRVSSNAMRIAVSGEGFSSDAKFEISVEGLTERGLNLFRHQGPNRPHAKNWFLARWRFSPDQTGKLDAHTDVNLEFHPLTLSMNPANAAKTLRTAPTRQWAALLIVLAQDRPRECRRPPKKGDSYDPGVACYIVVTPPLLPAASSDKKTPPDAASDGSVEAPDP